MSSQAFKRLVETFPNIELAINNKIINIIPNEYNKKFPFYDWSIFENKQYPLTRDDFKDLKPFLENEIKNLKIKLKDKTLTEDDKETIKKDISKIENVKTPLKEHRGNFGIIIGYNPENKPYWIGCLDIDGVKTDDETMKQTQKDFIEILKKLEGTILIQTQGGGYHLYFLTKQSYENERINNLHFPNDYHVEKIANQDINNNNDSIELFTNNNRQMAIPPSKIGKNEYKVLSDLKDWTKLKIYDDIVEEVNKLFKQQGYDYKETENIQNTNNTRNNKTTSKSIKIDINNKEISNKIVDHTIKFYNHGNRHNSKIYLNGIFIKNGLSKETILNFYEKINKKINIDMKAVYNEVERDFNKSVDNLAGWTSFKQFVTGKVPDEDLKELLQDFSIFKTNIKNDKLFIFNEKYTLKIHNKGYSWIDTDTQKPVTRLIKGKPLIEPDDKRDSNIANELIKKDSKINENKILNFIENIGLKLLENREKIRDKSTKLNLLTGYYNKDNELILYNDLKTLSNNPIATNNLTKDLEENYFFTLNKENKKSYIFDYESNSYKLMNKTDLQEFLYNNENLRLKTTDTNNLIESTVKRIKNNYS